MKKQAYHKKRTLWNGRVAKLKLKFASKSTKLASKAGKLASKGTKLASKVA
ncbi:hypothetical protein [Peribacillus sp. SI8-4]|uniref:hypothetical protein n=1 Tax=Peribacillus sp. SI8-4 TaxID=3048009 RepID=UPI0025579605|nr:hypothetical protein [Peribacillus sp. SI8-4]